MMRRQQFTLVGNPSGTLVELQRGSLLTFGPHDASVDLHILSGRLWITAEGDPNDQVLKAGDRGQVHGRNLVAEALSDAEICVA